MMYTVFSPAKKHASNRKRAAFAAMHIVASFFASAGVLPPAGVCPPGNGPSDLGRIAGWLAALAAIHPAEAMHLLAQNISTVSSKLMNDVQLEYNAGVRASRCDELPLLAPDELAARFAMHATTVSTFKELDTVVASSASPAAPRGRFYYIAAGIGSGISDIQQVGVLLYMGALQVDCLHLRLRHLQIRGPLFRQGTCVLELVRLTSTVSRCARAN
jgi:hypothetical protein